MAVIRGTPEGRQPIHRFFGSFAGSFWPLFVIASGVALLALASSGLGRGRYTATAGAVITGTGIILAAQDAVDYYQSWAYAWTLLPVCAGVAQVLTGRREDDDTAETTGRRVLVLGLSAFVGLGALFELFIFRRGPFDAALVLAIVLIAVGGYLLLLRPRMPEAGGNPSHWS